jgi:hypothetical protein
MIIGNVLGSPLISVPLTPGARQMDWSRVNVVGAVTNPYTGKQQIQSWLAGWWEATVTMPPMQRVQAGAWIAFTSQAQGMNSCFYFGDGLGKNAAGTAQGPGVTAGSSQVGYTLTTKGWTPNQFALFSPGDWIQIGYRLYQVLDQASSDSGGNSSFDIWPQIREVPPNGSAIITMGAQGLFRMKQNTLQYSESYDRTYRLSFQIREAI